MRLRNIAWIAAVALGAAACDDPLDVNPRASIPADQALQTAVELETAVTGLYDGLQDADGAYGRNAVIYPDLYAETLEFTGTYQTDREVDQGTVQASNVAIEEIWADFYDVVGRANNVLAALPDLPAEEATAAQLDEWRAQALFARAVAYFNLVRWFGDVPLVLEPTWDLEGDFQPAQAPMSQVYDQIETDLMEVIDLLPPEGPSNFATGYGAQTLLAKAYLAQRDQGTGFCSDARALLDNVIDEGPYVLVEDYADVFAVADNAELIFNLRYTVNDANNLAFWFFPYDLGGRLGVAPTTDLLESYEGLERFEASVGFDDFDGYYGLKYHEIATGEDDVPVLRLADAYLMRAEANWCLGEPAMTVVADINAVRERADVPLLDPAVVDTRDELEDALLHERMVELAMEGHRFFDLRRFGVATEVLGIDENQLYFPIPQSERDVNPNLDQNPGY